MKRTMDYAGNQPCIAAGDSIWEKAGICYNHWTYGKMSYQCKNPCIWMKN